MDGTAQKPMEGTSFLYSFDDPSAAERHTVRYFEIYGNRAIYKDGWWAACMLDHIPWDASPPTIARFAPGTSDPEQDRWELYYLPEDFTQAHDLAAEHPQKLAELKEPGARHQRLAGPLVAHSYIDSSLFALTTKTSNVIFNIDPHLTEEDSHAVKEHHRRAALAPGTGNVTFSGR